jgi:hypothetical protein
LGLFYRGLRHARAELLPGLALPLSRQSFLFLPNGGVLFGRNKRLAFQQVSPKKFSERLRPEDLVKDDRGFWTSTKAGNRTGTLIASLHILPFPKFARTYLESRGISLVQADDLRFDRMKDIDAVRFGNITRFDRFPYPWRQLGASMF